VSAIEDMGTRRSKIILSFERSNTNLTRVKLSVLCRRSAF